MESITAKTKVESTFYDFVMQTLVGSIEYLRCYGIDSVEDSVVMLTKIELKPMQ